MDCTVPPTKGNQVEFPKTINAHRMSHNFIDLKDFFLYQLITLTIFFGRRIPHSPNQAFGELHESESDYQVRDHPTQGWSTSSRSHHPWI